MLDGPKILGIKRIWRDERIRFPVFPRKRNRAPLMILCFLSNEFSPNFSHHTQNYHFQSSLVLFKGGEVYEMRIPLPSSVRTVLREAGLWTWILFFDIIFPVHNRLE